MSRSFVERTLRSAAVAAAAVTCALVLRLALEPLLQGTQAWLTFWPAAFLAAWYGGFAAGVATTLVAIAIVFGWVLPDSVLTATRAGVGAVVFLLGNVGFAYVAEMARRGRVQERRLLEREHEANRRMQALVELAAVLASAESLDAVGEAIVTEGTRGSGADTATLYVVDESEHRLRLVTQIGGAPEVVEQLRVIPLDSEHGKTLATERFVEAMAEYRSVLPQLASIETTARRAQAWWSIPLEAGGRMVGILGMGFYGPRAFREDERAFSRLFARHCAQAVARAERAANLERERLRLERLVDSNLIGTVFWNADGITRANDTFLASIGYTRDDLAAGAVAWHRLTPPEHADADRAARERVKAAGFHEPYAKELLHKDGHRVPVLVSSAAFFDDPSQGVTFVADVSDVKRAAEAANREKDAFLAMLGHELRNPLAPITTALDLIEMRGAAGAGKALAIIRRQVLHLTKLVDDLLDMSRIHTGRIQLVKEPTELDVVLGRAVEMVAPLLTERRHRLVTDVAGGLLVDVDLDRMAQVIANVLANAAKYSDPGSEIRVEGARDGADATLAVIDRGVGIDAALLPRVFDMFSQEAQSYDRSRGGLGLGLAIARTFVERHGGTITAHSDGKDRGSRFTIRLPIAAMRPVAAADVAPSAAAASGKPKRVLVVDDNRDAADMLAGLVEHRGHTTRRAGDGPEALRVLDDFVPDVALLDLGLPAMDGYELAQRVRGIPHLAGVKLVAVTGYGQPGDKERSRAAGFDLHLVKPVQLQDVIRAVEDE